MPLAPRKLAVLLFAGLALAVAGCGSNNKGKIEGKWKIVSAPGMGEQEMKLMEAFKMYAYMEFKPDGMMTIGAASTDPEMQKMIEGSPKNKTMSCKYKLLSGDGVEFYDMPKELQDEKGSGLFGKSDKSRVTVKIDGDNMTLTGSDGTGTLTRVK